MQRNRSHTFTLAIVLTALAPLTLAAQGGAGAPPDRMPPTRPRMAQSGPPDRMAPQPPMRRPGGPGRPGGNPAAMMLGLRQQLALTDDQIKRLETLQTTALPKPNEADMLRARADLIDATRGDGNLAGARAALDKMSRTKNDATLARIKLRQDARAVLTPAQRTTVDNMQQSMRGHRGAKAGKRGRPGKGGRPGKAGRPNRRGLAER